jgi:hypothetical protein
MLRASFPTPRYVAVELELNQGLAGKSRRFPRTLLAAIGASLETVVR